VIRRENGLLQREVVRGFREKEYREWSVFCGRRECGERGS